MTRSNQQTPTTKNAAAKKPVKTKQKTAKTPTKTGKKANVGAEIVSTEQRQQMTRELAYRLAEQRDFTPGNEESDWLEAEKQVNAQLLK